MKRLATLIGLFTLALIFSAPARADQNAQGWCESGAQPVITSGIASTTEVQASYPQCTIYVYVHGGGLATIYSNNSGGALSNPFTSNTNGQWLFYAADGRYDITMTGGGLPAPVTYSDVILWDCTVSCSGGGSGPAVAPNQNVIYASPNCGSQTNCYPVYFDTQFVGDASVVSTQSTVTTPSTDVAFTSADVGKVVFGSTDPLQGTIVLPQGTITALNSAHSITVSTTATATETGSLWLFWGHDDSTNLATAFAAAEPSTATQGNTLILPHGATLVSQAEFNANIASETACGATDTLFCDPNVTGQGEADPIIIATPNFNFTTCTGGLIEGDICFGADLGTTSNLTIWAGGNEFSGTHDNIVFQEGSGSTFDVEVDGFGAGATGLIGVELEPGTGSSPFNVTSYDAGTTACETPAEAGQFYIIAVTCWSDVGNGVVVQSAATLEAADSVFSGAGSGHAIDAIGSFYDEGGNLINAGGTTGTILGPLWFAAHPATFSSIIDTGISSGTSPICANGVGGAFTTSGCSGGGGGVSSFSGDGTLLSNSSSTGAVTATLENTGVGYGIFGNTGSSSGAPSYHALSAYPTAAFPTLNQSTTGNAATATALASTPSLCSTGDAPTGVLANGNATGCAAILTNPMTTLGDFIVGGSGGTPMRLAGPTSVGSVPQVMTSTPSGGGATQQAWETQGVLPNPQTGTTYTYQATDRTGYTTFNNSGSVAVTLPQAGTTGFALNWVNRSCNIGSGTVTITPTTSTISYTTGSSYTSGASSMTLSTGQCATIYTDNSNYFADRR